MANMAANKWTRSLAALRAGVAQPAPLSREVAEWALSAEADGPSRRVADALLRDTEVMVEWTELLRPGAVLQLNEDGGWVGAPDAAGLIQRLARAGAPPPIPSPLRAAVLLAKLLRSLGERGLFAVCEEMAEEGGERGPSEDVREAVLASPACPEEKLAVCFLLREKPAKPGSLLRVVAPAPAVAAEAAAEDAPADLEGLFGRAGGLPEAAGSTVGDVGSATDIAAETVSASWTTPLLWRRALSGSEGEARRRRVSELLVPLGDGAQETCAADLLAPGGQTEPHQAWMAIRRQWLAAARALLLGDEDEALLLLWEGAVASGAAAAKGQGYKDTVTLLRVREQDRAVESAKPGGKQAMPAADRHKSLMAACAEVRKKSQERMKKQEKQQQQTQRPGEKRRWEAAKPPQFKKETHAHPRR